MVVAIAAAGVAPVTGELPESGGVGPVDPAGVEANDTVVEEGSGGLVVVVMGELLMTRERWWWVTGRPPLPPLPLPLPPHGT